jgi:hypothetical protein
MRTIPVRMGLSLGVLDITGRKHPLLETPLQIGP